MSVAVFPLGPLNVNCYVVSREGDAVVVDPGGNPEQVQDFLREQKLQLRAILLTHLHFDHLYGVAALHEASGAPVHAAEADRPLLKDMVGQGGMWGFPVVDPFPFTPIQPGKQAFGALSCVVLATPGHSPGGLSFHFPEENLLCSGDTLFYRSAGRTDLPGGDEEQLLHSLRKVLFALPGETLVYPGHGPATTIADERRNNPFCGDFR